MSTSWQESIVLITSNLADVNTFGTGFVMHRDERAVYVLTCRHVVEEMGEEIKVEDKTAILITQGLDSIDLAVLQVEGLDKPALRLQGCGKKNKSFITVGFQTQERGKLYLSRPLPGKLGERVEIGARGKAGRAKAWDLQITDPNFHLEPGYSGSPVIEETNGYVMGVVTHSRGDKPLGLAISIEALELIWPEMPAGLLLQKAEEDAKTTFLDNLNETLTGFDQDQLESFQQILNVVMDLAPRTSKDFGEFELALDEDRQRRFLRQGGLGGQDIPSERDFADEAYPTRQRTIDVPFKEQKQQALRFQLPSAESPSLAPGEQAEDPQSRAPLPPGVSKVAQISLLPEDPPEKLFGRQAMLEEGCRLLLQNELPILVHGVPGIGKTAFLATLFKDPQIRVNYKHNQKDIIWINLRDYGISSLVGIVDAIAKARNYPDILDEKMTEAFKLKILRNYLLRDSPDHIIVFDNVDTDVHRIAVMLFQDKVTSRIVVGSREIVPLLHVQRLALEELDAPNAIEAFKSYADLKDGDDKQIDTICDLVGYHPHAIKLVAPVTYVKSLSLTELAQELERKRWELVQQGEIDYRFNMRLSFEFSYENLGSSEEGFVFDVCGAFAESGAPLSAIAAVCGLSVFECRSVLASLQGRSLIERGERNPDHYRMHKLLHDFAREKLLERQAKLTDGKGDLDNTPLGHLIHFYAEYAREHQEDFSLLEAAHDNLLQAEQWAWNKEAWKIVHNLWETLEPWLETTGDWKNQSQLQKDAIEANRLLPNREIELAKVLISYATYLELVGSINEAVRFAQESLELGERVKDDKTIVNGLVRIASLYQAHRHKHNEGHRYLQQAWKICKEIPDWEEVAYVAYQLGHSYWHRGDLGRAKTWLQKCARIAKGLKAQRFAALYEAFAITSLGNLFAQQKEYESARLNLQRSLELKQQIGNRHSIAITLSSLADLESNQQNYARAIELLNDALKIYREIGATSSVLTTLQRMGNVHSKEGNSDRALACFKEALDKGKPVELPIALASVAQRLGQIYADQRHYAEALGAYQQALALLDRKQDPQFYGVILHDIGNLFYKQQDYQQARLYYEQASEAKKRGNNRSDLVTTLQVLANVHLKLNEENKALLIFESCLSLLQNLPDKRGRLAGIYYQIGLIYERQERHTESLDAFERVLPLLDRDEDPQSYGVVLHSIGAVFSAQENYEQALEYYQQASEAKEHGSEPQDLVTTLQALARTQLQLGQAGEAILDCERCLSLLQSLPVPADRKQLAGVYYRLGLAYEQQKHYIESISAFERVLPLLDRDEDPQSYGVVLHSIGAVFSAQENYEQALEYYQQASEAKEHGSEPQDLVTTLQALARTQFSLNQPEVALQTYERCLSLLKDPSRHEELEYVAVIHHQRGRIYESQECYVEAFSTYQQALHLLDRERNPQFYGVVLHDLGNISYAQQNYQQAYQYYQEASAAKEHGNNIPDLVTTLQALARTQSSLDQLEEAIQTCERSLALLRSLPKPGEARYRWQLLAVLAALGQLCQLQKHLERAIPVLEEACHLFATQPDLISIQEQSFLLITLAAAYAEVEQDKEVERLRQVLQTLVPTVAEPEAMKVAVVYYRRGQEYKRNHQFTEAEAAYQQALVWLDSEQDSQSYGIVLHELGDVSYVQKHYEQALHYYQQAAEYKERGNNISDLISTLQTLARTQFILKHPEEATQTHERSLALLRSLPKPGEARYRWQLLAVLAALGQLYQLQKQPERAIAALEEAHRLFSTQPDLLSSHEQSFLLLTLAAAFAEVGQDREVERIRQTLVLTTAEPKSLEIAVVYYRRGREQERNHQFTEAEAAYQQALVWLDSEQDSQSYGIVLHELGDVSYVQKHYEQALHYYQQAAEYKEHDKSDPSSLVSTLQNLAHVQLNLDQENEALQTCERCLSLLQNLPAPAKPDTIALAYLQRGRIYEYQERYTEALGDYQRALQAMDRDQDVPLYGMILQDIGDVFFAQEDYQQALTYYQQASVAKERAGTDPSDLATTLQSLAHTLVQLDRPREALQTYERCLSLMRNLPSFSEPDDFKELLIILGRLGQLYWQQEQPERAIPYLEEVRRLFSAQAELVSVQEQEITLALMAAAYAALGREEEAARMQEEAQAVLPARPLTPAEMVVRYHRQGRFYEQKENYTEALTAYRQALSLLDGEQEPQFYGVVLHDLGDVCRVQDQLEQALHYYQQAATYKERGNKPANLVTTLQAQAEVLVELEQDAEAQQVYERCLALLQGLPAPGEPERQAEVHHQRGRAYERQRQYAQALQLLDAEQEPQFYGVVLHDIGDVYRAQGKLEQTLEYYQRAAVAKERGDNTKDLITTLRVLADVQLALGQETEAVQVLEKGLQLLRELPAPGEPKRLAGMLVLLGQIYLAQAQPETALPYMEEARTLIAEEGVAAPQEQLSILTLLATTYVALGQNKQAAQALLSADNQEQDVVSLYTKALEIYQQALQLLDAEHEPQTYGVVLHSIGHIYQVQGELEQALRYYQRAREAKMRSDNRIDLVITLQTLANVLFELGQVAEALSIYQECLALLGELPSSDELERSKLRPNDPGILMQVARCQEALNSWAEAIDTYKLLEGILLEEFRQEPNPTAQRRLAWTKYKLGMFEEAAKLCNQVDTPETDIDKARARLIAASIAYILGDQSAAKDNIHYVSTNGVLTSSLKWEVKHDIRYVIKYHVPKTDLEQFLALIDAT